MQAGVARGERPRGRVAESLRGDAGVAMVAVIMISLAFVLISATIIMRAINLSSNTETDRRWERSYAAAEGGVDDALSAIVADLDYATVDGDVDLTTRQAIISAARDVARDDPSAVIPVPDGQAVVVKPDGEDIVYSVGFVPSIDDEGARVRVVMTEYSVRITEPASATWTGEFALLSGGDLRVGGSARVNNPGANVHANASLDADESHIDGCGSESLDSGFDPGPGCPPSPAPTVAVPLVDPMAAYHLSWFDMCPDGTVHGGPAHPASPNATATPCAGPLLPGRQGMTPTDEGWFNNDKNTPAGVYFVVGDFDGRVGFNNGLEVTIITAKGDYSLDCSAAGGNIWVSSQSSAVGHPSAGGLTLVAAGDVVFRGGAEFRGLVLAHEQIDYKGNSAVTGAVVSESGCNTAGSPVTTAEMSGTADIFWDGPVSTPFAAYNPGGPLDPEITILSQREL